MVRQLTGGSFAREFLRDLRVSWYRRTLVLEFLPEGRHFAPRIAANVLDQRLLAVRNVWGAKRVGVGPLDRTALGIRAPRLVGLTARTLVVQRDEVVGDVRGRFPGVG